MNVTIWQNLTIWLIETGVLHASVNVTNQQNWTIWLIKQVCCDQQNLTIISLMGVLYTLPAEMGVLRSHLKKKLNRIGYVNPFRFHTCRSVTRKTTNKSAKFEIIKTFPIPPFA